MLLSLLTATAVYLLTIKSHEVCSGQAANIITGIKDQTSMCSKLYNTTAI